MESSIRKMKMRQVLTARIFQEDNWFVAQCLEVEIASQGETETEALANLQEALDAIELK